MSIALTIFRQIRAMDYFSFARWGSIKSDTRMDMGDGLKFKTAGSVRWKGWVYIKYDEGQDLYTVIFAQIRKFEWKEIKRVEGVFFDQLVAIIDRQVG